MALVCPLCENAKRMPSPVVVRYVLRDGETTAIFCRHCDGIESWPNWHILKTRTV